MSKTIDQQVVRAAEMKIREQFFNVDATIEKLKHFVAMNESAPRTGNLILWGPGGYGKSEISAMFLEEITGERPFVVNMSQSTTTAEIWGGVNIPDLIEKKEWGFNIENSFLQHEYVIFEEGLEPRPKVLSALKHLLTSGWFEVAGAQPIQIKTKGIIIVTNVDTAQFMSSEEDRALLERFPLSQRVSWENLNTAQRIEASRSVVGKFDPDGMISDMLANKIAERATSQRMSPRIIGRIVHALTSYEKMFNNSKAVSDTTFAMVAATFGIADEAELTEEIQETRVKENVAAARKTLGKILDKVEQRITSMESLYDQYNNPSYMARIARQLMITQEFLEQASIAVADIRTQPEYGDFGAELASWANEQFAELLDRMERIKESTWDGLLNTVATQAVNLQRLESKLAALQEQLDDNE